MVRAKRKRYIPVVLSREEIDAIVGNLKYPYDLVVKLLHGCGLRLFECLNLRVQSFNFDLRVQGVQRDGESRGTPMKICVSYPVGVCCVIIFSFSILDQVDILILLINLPF